MRERQVKVVRDPLKSLKQFYFNNFIYNVPFYQLLFLSIFMKSIGSEIS